MRPVTRQPWPIDRDGERIEYRSYKSFFSKLINNFGHYCSYCEGVSKLDIEHVIPKSIDPALMTEWTNLLLGCSSCNRDFKRNKNNSRDGYAWPDEADTFEYYQYFSSGDVKAAQNLPNDLRTKAEATLSLCGLNPQPKHEIKEPNDYLWQQRSFVWVVAEMELEKYSQAISSVGSIASLAVATGHWSVWVSVFNEHIDVVRAISQKYNGTLNKYCV